MASEIKIIRFLNQWAARAFFVDKELRFTHNRIYRDPKYKDKPWYDSKEHSIRDSSGFSCCSGGLISSWVIYDDAPPDSKAFLNLWNKFEAKVAIVTTISDFEKFVISFLPLCPKKRIVKHGEVSYQDEKNPTTRVNGLSTDKSYLHTQFTKTIQEGKEYEKEYEYRFSIMEDSSIGINYLTFDLNADLHKEKGSFFNNLQLYFCHDIEGPFPLEDEKSLNFIKTLSTT